LCNTQLAAPTELCHNSQGVLGNHADDRSTLLIIVHLQLLQWRALSDRIS
jgi:hypothetical protein